MEPDPFTPPLTSESPTRTVGGHQSTRRDPQTQTARISVLSCASGSTEISRWRQKYVKIQRKKCKHSTFSQLRRGCFLQHGVCFQCRCSINMTPRRTASSSAQHLHYLFKETQKYVDTALISDGSRYGKHWCSTSDFKSGVNQNGMM